MRFVLAIRLLALVIGLTVLPATTLGSPWVVSPEAPAYFAVDVVEMDAAIAWYTQALGLEVLSDTTAEGGLWRIANLGREEILIELIFDRRSSALGEGDRVHGLAKVGFSVPDVRLVADRVEADTGERPRVLDFESGGIRLIQLHDPEGNIIQLHSPLSDEPEDEQVLLQLHRDVLRYHMEGDLESWMAGESEDYVSANRGEISRPSVEDRRARLEPYLTATTFTKYRDVVEPVVRVSEDGTLGWVICQIEIEGERGGEEIGSEWAWIELYAKQDGEWRRVGNVSNRKD